LIRTALPVPIQSVGWTETVGPGVGESLGEAVGEAVGDAVGA
jgi:hypothetical protein